MTPLDPAVIRESFALIRTVTPEAVHEIVDMLERRLLLDESMLSMNDRLRELENRLAYGAPLSAPGGTSGPAAVDIPADRTERALREAGAEIYPFPGHSVRVS